MIKILLIIENFLQKYYNYNIQFFIKDYNKLILTINNKIFTYIIEVKKNKIFSLFFVLFLPILLIRNHIIDLKYFLYIL